MSTLFSEYSKFINTFIPDILFTFVAISFWVRSLDSKDISPLKAYIIKEQLSEYFVLFCRTQWPCGLKRGSAVACLLGLWGRIPPGGMEISLL